MAKRGKNEGSIYRDKDGRWRAAVDHGYENGERKRKLLSGRTRAEVAAKLTIALRDRQMNLPAADERYTVEQHLQHWLGVARLTVRPNTFRTYSDFVAQHLAPMLGRIPLQKLTPEDVRQFMTAKLDGGLSARSVRHIRAALRCALNVAVKEGKLLRNVAAIVDPPRVDKKYVPQVFTPEQARDFLQAVKGHRFEALFVLTLALGLREGEVIGLRWQDIDFDSGTVGVYFQVQRLDGRLQLVELKTEHSRRVIPLPEFAKTSLREHRLRQAGDREAACDKWVDTGMVFTTGIGTMLDARNVLRSFYSILKANPALPRIRFHDLRHSAATLLLVQGVHPKVVQEIGGWSDIRTVLNTYTHVIPALKHDAATKMDALLNPLASSSASSS